MGDKFGCPICGSTNLKVTNTYSGEAAICRRRVCQRCGTPFSTYEAVSGFPRGERALRNRIIADVSRKATQ